MNRPVVSSKRSRAALFAAIVFLGIVSASTSRAQGLNSDGRDFYLGYLAPSVLPFLDSATAKFHEVYALLTTYSDNDVTVSYFNDIGKEVSPQSYHVSRGRSLQLPLDISRMRMTEPGEQAEFRSCHITARRPINVTYFSSGADAGGSYLAISTPALGKTYVVESYHDNVGGVGGVVSNENSSGYFMVIAPFDGTTVQITPSSTTKGNHPGVTCGAGASGTPQPFIVYLVRGQCYMVKSAGTDPTCDISGTTIVADRPIAVIAGHENAFTDGGDPKPGGTKPLEARDYMVEQMLPVEYWDTTGYVSVPFVDSQAPANAGHGDEYRLFCGVLPELSLPGPTGSIVNLDIAGFSNPALTQSMGPYAIPVPGRPGVTTPADGWSSNGTKIGLVQYDQRMQGGGAPYPAPSQLTIIPESRWRHSCAFDVPANRFEILQGYYINFLCNRDDYNKFRVKLGINGGKPQPIQAVGLGIKRLFMNMGLGPQYDSIVGVQFALGPGTYNVIVDSSGHPFMIYNYGFRAIDKDNDLGDMDSDDFFFSYANPTAFAKTGESATAGKMVVTVDTLCNGWHICAKDTRPKDRGIKMLQIIDDSLGEFYGKPYPHSNLQLDPNLFLPEEQYRDEVDLAGNDTLYCFNVYVDHLQDTAYGSVVITDNDGHDYIVSLHKAAAAIAVSTLAPAKLAGDTLQFPRLLPGKETCATVIYRNRGTSGVVHLNSVVITGSSDFTLQSVVPALPVSLSPGDSLAVTVCVSPTKLGPDSATLAVGSDCAPITLDMREIGSVPLIFATDKDFGKCIIGLEISDTVTVRNVGDLPLTLTDTTINACFVHGNRWDFAWDSLSVYDRKALPKTLQPGQFVRLAFLFAPSHEGRDSALVNWITDVTGLYKDSLKSWTLLKGEGIVPGVYWTADSNSQLADTAAATLCDTFRVELVNISSATTHVQKVLIEGPDASEFRFIANQRGYGELEGFDINPGDSLWVDIEWCPDLSKPLPARFADRHALLVATFNVPGHTALDSTTMTLTRRFGPQLGTPIEVSPDAAEPLRASITDGSLFIWLPASVQSLELYDLLGRRVGSWALRGDEEGGEVRLPLPQLEQGVYILRASGAGRTISCKVVRE